MEKPGILLSLAAIAAVSLTMASFVEAGILPPLGLKHLVASADLIVVGRVTGVRDEGPALAKTTSGDVEARDMTATLQVDRILKGHLSARTVEFGFTRPEKMIGYWPIGEGEFGAFFLKSGPSGLAVADHYHPYVVALQGATVTGATAFERVIAELAAVLVSPTASRSAHVLALQALDHTPGPEATAALLNGARAAPGNLRYHSIAALLRRNNIAYLKEAANLLVHPPGGAEQDWLADIALGLSGVRDPRAIPALSEILGKSPLADARRSAAHDLRSMHNAKTIKPLAVGLYDTNPEVQYLAVIGLAVETGAASKWSPAEGTFRKNPKEYLEHWREWAKANGYAKGAR